MPKIETLFSQFAKGSFTILSEKKDWPKIKRMSKAKNADVWGQVWEKTARPAAISALRSAKLGLTEAQIKAIADDFERKRKAQFIKYTTDTDIKRLKKLSRSKGDLEEEIKSAGINSLSRKELIERNEAIEAGKGLLLEGHKLAGFSKKRWKLTSNKPCEICRAREGETRPIDKSYSNGSQTAHAHPGCMCEDEYL